MALGKKLNGTLRSFIERQHVFFVATAAETGRVNVSPKGADSLRIIDDTHLRWLNLSGSGNETAGHLLRSNRITLMFCAFEGDARILRLYGQAKIMHPRDDGWSEADRVTDELVPYYDEMGPEGVEAYWRKKNTQTIDGFDTGLFED